MTGPVQHPASTSDAAKRYRESIEAAGLTSVYAGALRAKDEFSIRVPETTALTIKHPDGRDLLVFHRDGTVTGDPGEASEAAAIFVREVKRMFGTPAGRCGARTPGIRLPGPDRTPPVHCALPAGHAGWHKGDDGSEWTRGPEWRAGEGALRDRFCDCEGRGLHDDQHAPSCHGLEVVAALIDTAGDPS